MGYKNVKDLLVDATKLPAAIEAQLPAGAPAISTMLADVAGKLPAMPDLPIELPDLPEPPALPEIAPPGGDALTRYVTGAEVEAPKVAPPKAAPTTPRFLY